MKSRQRGRLFKDCIKQTNDYILMNRMMTLNRLSKNSLEKIFMIYDISMLIHPHMQTYKNNKEKAPIFKTNQDIQTSTSHDTTVTLNLHTGTHMDYPLHMV